MFIALQGDVPGDNPGCKKLFRGKHNSLAFVRTCMDGTGSLASQQTLPFQVFMHFGCLCNLGRLTIMY